MNMSKQEPRWSPEDFELQAQFRDVIDQFQAANDSPAEPSHSLDRRILQLSRQRHSPNLQKNWMLGQGPWVILVTCILFAVAMLVLLGTN